VYGKYSVLHIKYQKSIAISKILPVIELQSIKKASSREFPMAHHFQWNK
jgi:hypothetical protein